MALRSAANLRARPAVHCIGCAFLVAHDDKGSIVALSAEERKVFKDGIASFRNIPSPLSCEHERWGEEEFGNTYVSELLAVEVPHDYVKQSLHTSICEVDRSSLGCFARFDPTASNVDVALQRAQERVHRKAQASLDRRLLRITVAALVLSSAFSLASLVVSVIALRSPVDIDGPVDVRLVPSVSSTSPSNTNNANSGGEEPQGSSVDELTPGQTTAVTTLGP